MRALLTFLLCLAVAFQGIANADAFEQPCPMEQGMQAATMASMDVPADAEGCCNDADTAARTGKLCKTGQACNLSYSCPVTLVQPPMQVPASPCLVPTARLIPPSFDPSGVWRPPTFS